MLIDDWLGSEVVVEYVGGRLLEEGTPTDIGAAKAGDEVPRKVKPGTFVLQDYDRFGVEVRTREASGPYLLPWGAILAMASAEGEPSQLRGERPEGSREAPFARASGGHGPVEQRPHAIRSGRREGRGGRVADYPPRR